VGCAHEREKKEEGGGGYAIYTCVGHASFDQGSEVDFAGAHVRCTEVELNNLYAEPPSQLHATSASFGV
jgi:hypothetical protein